MRRPDGHPIIARILDRVMAPMARIRRRVVPRASGRVLEVGVGTGMNLPEYRPGQVREVVGIDPDPHMRKRAAQRAAAVPVQVLPHGAESLPFSDHDFDSVVMTFTLCTIPHVEAALAEIRRVLKPDGELHFAEHTRSDHPVTAWLQQAVDPVYTRFAGGCHLHRDAHALLEAGGFEVVELHGHSRGPFNLTPVHRGVARARTNLPR